MKLISLQTAPKVPFDLDGYIVHTSPQLEVVHLLLHAGQQVAIHTNPFDVVICIIQGEATLYVESGEVTPELYATVEIKAGQERAIANKSANDCRLLVLKKLG